MAGEAPPMSDIQGYSDEELKELGNSEVGERKKAFAAEVLRRRREASWNAWVQKHLAWGIPKPVVASYSRVGDYLSFSTCCSGLVPTSTDSSPHGLQDKLRNRT
jgi:hypothetical protein